MSMRLVSGPKVDINKTTHHIQSGIRGGDTSVNRTIITDYESLKAHFTFQITIERL